MNETLQQVQQRLAHEGHGHVWLRTDGRRSACGGRTLCAQCQREHSELEMAANPVRTKDFAVLSEPASSVTESLATVVQDLAFNGHGHVVPRNDGCKMRCSGTMGCGICQRDQARFIAAGGTVVIHKNGAVSIANPHPVNAVPKPPTMSYVDFVLTRADLEVRILPFTNGRWQARLSNTDNSIQVWGDTREAVLRETYSKWVKAGCP